MPLPSSRTIRIALPSACEISITSFATPDLLDFQMLAKKPLKPEDEIQFAGGNSKGAAFAFLPLTV
jgi:hypothetical protein